MIIDTLFVFDCLSVSRPIVFECLSVSRRLSICPVYRLMVIGRTDETSTVDIVISLLLYMHFYGYSKTRSRILAVWLICWLSQSQIWPTHIL